MNCVRLFDVAGVVEHDRRATAVIVAAGSFSRMNGIPKQLLLLGNMPVVAHTINSFQNARNIRDIVLVARQEDVEEFCDLCKKYRFDKVVAVVSGGQTRQQSVIRGVRCISDTAKYIAVHDGARPLIKPERIDQTVEAAWQYNAAAVAVPVKDTVKVADENQFIEKTPERSRLWNVQTPQVFEAGMFLKAMHQADVNENDFTDDCQMVEQIGQKVYLVKSDYDNIKITTPEDIAFVRSVLGKAGEDIMRIGHGYDVHRLETGRRLILGGVDIPFEKGLLGHSDADVLTHAVIDSILGAAALGDIGKMFPDNDDAYSGADSILLLSKALKKVSLAGYRVGNVDAVVIAQQPRLTPFIEKIRSRLANTLEVDIGKVSVKATTEEKLGFTGAGEGIAAHAVCLLREV